MSCRFFIAQIENIGKITVKAVIYELRPCI